MVSGYSGYLRRGRWFHGRYAPKKREESVAEKQEFKEGDVVLLREGYLNIPGGTTGVVEGVQENNREEDGNLAHLYTLVSWRTDAGESVQCYARRLEHVPEKVFAQNDIVRLVAGEHLPPSLLGKVAVVATTGDLWMGVTLLNGTHRVVRRKNLAHVAGAWHPLVKYPLAPIKGESLVRPRSNLRAHETTYLGGSVHTYEGDGSAVTLGGVPFAPEFFDIFVEEGLPPVAEGAPRKKPLHTMPFARALAQAQVLMREPGEWRYFVRQRSWDKTATFAAIDVYDKGGALMRSLYSEHAVAEELARQEEEREPRKAIVRKDFLGGYYRVEESLGKPIMSPRGSFQWTESDIRGVKDNRHTWMGHVYALHALVRLTVEGYPFAATGERVHMVPLTEDTLRDGFTVRIA